MTDRGVSKATNNFADVADKVIQTLIEKWPEIEAKAIEIAIAGTDALFTPKLMIKHLLVAIAIQTGLVSVTGVGVLAEKLLRRFTANGRKRNAIEEAMKNAKTYAEWKRYAEELDALIGFDKWRLEEDSGLYNVKVLKKRMKDIRAMLNSEDVFNMMFRLRGALSRDQFGMQQQGLFNRAIGGTKVIVEEYHQLLINSLNYICDHSDPEVPSDAKLAFFNETRHAYGRTALLLSGGAALGGYHLGVIKTLFREGLLPRVISGASAGSLIASVIGIRTDEELNDLLNVAHPEDFLKRGLRLDFFGIKEHEPSTQWFQYILPQSLRNISDALIGHFVDNTSILRLDTDHLKHVFIQNIGLQTFQEAFDRTGRIINITVSPNNSYDPPRLLNYLTAPHVCIWSAAVASCAIPGVFDSISLVCKEPSGDFYPENEWGRKNQSNSKAADDHVLQSYSDGSIERDLPMQQISELFNVNHFIVSQVNPHSALLSNLSFDGGNDLSPIFSFLVGYLRYLKGMLRDWVSNLMDLFVYRSSESAWGARRGLSQLLTQEYEGREEDITIVPWKGAHNAISGFMAMIHNADGNEVLEMVHVGCKNTWPEISRIRAHCSVEMTLDKCVQRLRKRISLENYNKHLVQEQSRGLDRTPSFYTSRSIVNLSGLSVSDPLPRLSEKGLAKADRRRQSSNQSLGGRRSSGGTNGSEASLGDTDLLTSNSNDELIVQRVELYDYDNDDIGVGVQIEIDAEVDSGSRKTAISDSVALTSIDAAATKTDSVHKTTNMANFYYKKSSSKEDLI